MSATATLSYEVFVNDALPHKTGVLPSGEPKAGSPVASTLIYGNKDAVLTDPAFTVGHARSLGDWIVRKRLNLTDIFITHGHGDHWFAAGLLAERFAARVVATEGTIKQMRAAVAARPLLWDKAYSNIPPAPVTALTVPGNRLTLEEQALEIVEVGHADTDDNSVLYVPDLGLVVAGDVIYNGVHLYLAESAVMGGFERWRNAIDMVEALNPVHIVAGHQNKQLDDDAGRTIAETREYLDDADNLLLTCDTAVDFFNAKIERYPNHLARTVLWASANALYAVRAHPSAEIGPILVAGWL